MAGMALTRRQKEVLEYIAKFLQDNGYSPSYEEIAHGLELASLAKTTQISTRQSF